MNAATASGAPSHAAELHCWYARNKEEALGKGRYLLGHYGSFLNHRRVVELGCGEGAFLLGLQNLGYDDIVGVDSNPELCALARSFGVPVQQSMILDFLRQSRRGPAVYLYLDVIEHVPFDENLEILNLIPVGSRVILQTPYTRSLKGHEFYFNVPSHVAAYSPWVIRNMLERLGYKLNREGSIEGHHPPTWKNRVRALFIRKVLGIDPELLLGGGNYFVVADRLTDHP